MSTHIIREYPKKLKIGWLSECIIRTLNMAKSSDQM